jgi:hypothetical protein
MVQDVSLDGGEDDDTITISPYSTPGLSDGEDYFAHGGQAGRGSITSRQYSGSIMTRKNSSAPQRRRKPLSRLHTEVLLKMVLQDAQTRLVFRAQALIQADVQYYAPREGDLDYPDKLGTGEYHKSRYRSMLILGMEGKSLVPQSPTTNLDDEDDAVILSLPPPEAQETWYPTLRVTLWVLSCLYTYVDVSRTFFSIMYFN